MGNRTSRRDRNNKTTVNAGHSLDYRSSDFVDERGAVVPPPPTFTATGGTEYTPGNGYKYHKFTSNGNFVVTTVEGDCDILVVAGGGSGGNYYGGGGGAGGVAYGVDVPMPVATHPVVVGAGGAAVDATGIGLVGNNTTVGAPGVSIGGQPDYIVAKGGGYGGRGTTTGGGAGGSGGGDGGGNSPPYGGLATQPGTNPSPVITDYGFPGGWSYPSGGYAPAGGGGAGAQGVNITGNIPGAGNGGVGVAIPGFEYPLVGMSPYSPLSPSNNHYGGGGGAGMYGSPVAPDRTGTGGYGGGGGDDGIPGTNYLGGGGGGKHPPGSSSGKGGDGIVIVRYLA